MESLESLESFEAWQLGWLGELGKLWLMLQPGALSRVESSQELGQAGTGAEPSQEPSSESIA